MRWTATLLLLASLAACAGGPDRAPYEPPDGGESELPDGSVTPPDGGDEDDGGDEAEVATLSILPEVIDLEVEDELEMVAVAMTDEGAPVVDADIEWSVDDPERATISDEGVLLGLLPGPVTVTARVGQVSATSSGVIRHTSTAAPTLTGLSPPGAVAGSADLELTVIGVGFIPTSQVLWGGDALETTFISPSELGATVAAEALVDAGAVEVRVETPGFELPAAVTFAIYATTVEHVVVTPETATIGIGQEATLRAVLFDGNGARVPDGDVSWTSDNGNVATVVGDGTVRAHAEGTIFIKAWHGSKMGKASVTVRPGAVHQVFVSPSSPVLIVGERVQLQARTVVEGGGEVTGRVVTWSTDDPAIVTVDAAGFVQARARGKTRVYARSEGKVGVGYVDVR